MGETAPLVRLGELLEQDRPRDAVHIAIIPAVAGEELRPGQPVYVVDGRGLPCPSVWETERMGVVDPFLRGPVKAGERFWLLLTPGTITSLRHEWTHPAFPSPSGVEWEESRRWFQAHVVDHIYDDANLQEVLADLVEGNGLSFNSESARDWAEANASEIWYHAETLAGKRFAPDHRQAVYFGCAC